MKPSILQIRNRLHWESQALRDFIDAPKNSRPHRKPFLEAAKSRKAKIDKLCHMAGEMVAARKALRGMWGAEARVQKKAIRSFSRDISALRKEVAV